MSRKAFDAQNSGFGAAILDPNDRDPVELAELRAWLSLQATLGLRPQLARECLARDSDPRKALALSGFRPRLDRAELELAVERLRRTGTLALPIHSPAYPAQLLSLPDAPPLLLVRGAPSDLAEPGVAIVGARAATAYGLGVARELASELARAGAVVISGLARGIDAAAHEGALDAGGRTVAVQACGPDRTYPAGHRALAERIRRQGAIATEFPPGTAPLPAFFPLRNRLISGLSRLVIVVEARIRSGSLITARHAADQGREVMAVPGPITVATSAGPNELLRDGATPILSIEQFLEDAGFAELRERPKRPAPTAPEQRTILKALRHEALSLDELERALSFSPGVLRMHLLELELAGRVEQDRTGRWVPSARSDA